MTVNARWQSRRSRYRAVVPAPELPFTYRISIALVPAPELSFLWRHVFKRRNMTSQKRQLCSGNESYRNSVRERQLWSGNNSFVTWRSPSYFVLASNHYITLWPSPFPSLLTILIVNKKQFSHLQDIIQMEKKKVLRITCCVLYQQHIFRHAFFDTTCQ